MTIYQYLMQIDHKDYGISENVGFLRIKPMSNSDFKGQPPAVTWFLANIYWAIRYQIFKDKNSKTLIKTSVNILPKSWIRCQQKQLLKHEYGHYLIGCICALAFQKKINFQLNLNQKQNASAVCDKTLKDCLKFYCAQERLYDQQTCHYLNQQNQLIWQQKIKKQINDFSIFFQKNKPVEKPEFTLKINLSKNMMEKNLKHKIEDRKRLNILRNNKISNTSNNYQHSSSIMSKKTSLNNQINLYKAIQNMPAQRQTFNRTDQYRIRSFSKPK